PLTHSHHVLGTPAYLAPEQALGKEVDARADVYALGAVLYTMLCGEPPYQGEIPSAVIGKLLQGEPPPLEDRQPDLPPALAALFALVAAATLVGIGWTLFARVRTARDGRGSAPSAADSSSGPRSALASPEPRASAEAPPRAARSAAAPSGAPPAAQSAAPPA